MPSVGSNRSERDSMWPNYGLFECISNGGIKSCTILFQNDNILGNESKFEQNRRECGGME